MSRRGWSPGTIVALGVDGMAARRIGVGAQLTFLLDGEERSVELGKVASVRRGGRRVVQLLDLWVASLLPGELLDLSFEILAEDDDGAAVRSPPIDGVRLASGYVAIASSRLWWDGCRDGVPHGMLVRSVVVHAPPASARCPVDLPAEPAPAPPLESKYARVLPAIAFRYPAVEWRLRTG